ncbi:MAG: AAA family ATPase [Planctomycetes bacterium]|nr:AAA family ATPase [Planctomycetota bacterium]
MTEKLVYLMRGLPSCGKSYTARKLAGDTGVVCETDEYFYTQVGDDPTRYNYREDLLEAARSWNFERFRRAVDAGISPIVVDRGNSPCLESQRYARYAVERGYRVELKEPESAWWQEIRVLLKYKKITKVILYKWADRLARMNRSTHRVPASTIRRWMDRWRYDLTVEEILNYRPLNNDSTPREHALVSSRYGVERGYTVEPKEPESLVIGRCRGRTETTSATRVRPRLCFTRPEPMRHGQDRMAP